MLMRPTPSPVVMHLISSLRVGGAERLMVTMMQAADVNPAARFVVVVMNDEIDEALWAALAATRFPLYRLGRRQGHLSPRYLREVLSIARRHGVEVIHTHNEGSRTWGMIARMLRPSLRLVYTVHAEGIGREITGLRRAAYLRLVDTTVAISRAVETECRAFGSRTVVLAENGIDLDAFRAARSDRTGGGPLRVVSVGRFAPVKGQDILIEAVDIARRRGVGVTLTLAGTRADPAFHDRLMAMVAERGLDSSVYFVLDRTDIPVVLTDGDAFVLPSREEGFGLALVEAMAAGLPVIASRTGGAAELVSDGINGFSFTPGDAAQLADRLALLAADPALRARLASAGAETAARYDIRTTLARHMDAYRGLTQAATA